MRNIREPGPNRVLLTYDREEAEIDYHVHSELLVETLRDELSKRGVEISDAAERTLSLGVAHMNLVLALGGCVCYVDFNLQTSGGYVHGYAATAKSGNRHKACNAAVAAGVTQLLHDPVMLRFLESG